jgi:hypothetical protein
VNAAAGGNPGRTPEVGLVFVSGRPKNPAKQGSD